MPPRHSHPHCQGLGESLVRLRDGRHQRPQEGALREDSGAEAEATQWAG